MRPSFNGCVAVSGFPLLDILFAAVGIRQGLDANCDTAPPDARYSDRWNTLSNDERRREVVKGSIGPAPVLAAGALAQTGIVQATTIYGLG